MIRNGSFLDRPRSDLVLSSGGTVNHTPRNADILVLESDWGEDLCDAKSTRPFIEGLADALGITAVFRSFHTGRDLEHWMHQVFLSGRKPRIVYIATHGSRRCLYHPWRPGV